MVRTSNRNEYRNTTDEQVCSLKKCKKQQMTAEDSPEENCSDELYYPNKHKNSIFSTFFLKIG